MQTTEVNKTVNFSLRIWLPIVIGFGLLLLLMPSIVQVSAEGIIFCFTHLHRFFSSVSILMTVIVWVLLGVISYFIGERLDRCGIQRSRNIIVYAMFALSVAIGISILLSRLFPPDEEPETIVSSYWEYSYPKSPIFEDPWAPYMSPPVTEVVYRDPYFKTYPSQDEPEDSCLTTCTDLVGYGRDFGYSGKNYTTCMRNCMESDN